jgi:hypothetical protein
MNPEVDKILGVSASQLMTQLAPLLPTGYAQGSASLLSVMMVLAAQEYDRAAEIRVAENADMRALFGELAPLVSAPALRADLQRAANAEDASLAISALNESNAALRRLLIALQTHVEEAAGIVARTAEARIWEVLKASAARRLLRLA